jgi:hypothetical protein
MKIDKGINMIIIAAGLNGIIKVYYNEMDYSEPNSPVRKNKV